MLTQIINGQILTPQGWLKDGSVLISDGKILEVTNSDLAVIGATVVDAKGMYIIPGFVAMNIHGGGGYDFKECTEEAFHGAVNAHMKYGATCIFPTLAPLPMTEIRKGVALCESAMVEKNSPVLGLQLASAFTGAILTESIFSWPGMGTLIVSAIDNRDYALIQGVVLFTAVVFVVINLIVDIVYTIINPKVSYESGKGGN